MESRPSARKRAAASLSFLSYVTHALSDIKCSVPDRTCLSVARNIILQNELGLVMLIGHGPWHVE
jgi:hypothetical protein